MANPDLLKYIQTSREQKISDMEIKEQLIKAGWAKDEVEVAFVPQSVSTVTLPPPPVPRIGMWISFLYAILFIGLYVSAINFAGVLHYYVDQLFKDPLKIRSYSFFSMIYGSDEALIFNIASLLVAFPIFAGLFLYLKRKQLTSPAIKNLQGRKRLIYVTLVVTFLIMLGNLIGSIYNLLNGSLTTNSIAHLTVTIGVTGSIFVNYILEVKEDRRT